MIFFPKATFTFKFVFTGPLDEDSAENGFDFFGGVPSDEEQSEILFELSNEPHLPVYHLTISHNRK